MMVRVGLVLCLLTARAAAECPPGQRQPAGASRCCWIGQQWSAQARACIGMPAACPPGQEPSGADCKPMPPLDRSLAMAELDDALLQDGFRHHQAGQRLRSARWAAEPHDSTVELWTREEFQTAADRYGEWLDRFGPLHPDRLYETTYERAETLFFAARYGDAAPLYARVRDWPDEDQYREDAAVSAVLALGRVVDAGEASGKLPQRPLPHERASPPGPPLPLAEERARLQAACDVYVKLFPTGNHALEYRARAAYLAYSHLRFADALARLEPLLELTCPDATQFPDVLAAIVYIHTVEKRPAEVARWKAWADKQGCARPSPRKRMQTAEALMLAKRYDEAAELFLALAEADLHAYDRDKMLNNAAVCYEYARRYRDALAQYRRITVEHPHSPFVDDALFRVAVSEQRMFEFGDAERDYARLASDARFATSKHRADALYNAAVLASFRGDDAHAAERFARYAALPEIKDRDAVDAWRLVALARRRAGDAAGVVKAFERAGDRARGDARLARHVRLELAEALLAAHDARAAREALHAAGARLDDADDELAARVTFLLADADVAPLEHLTILPSPRLEREAAAARKRVERVAAGFDAVARFRSPRWRAAALARAAYAWELYSRAVGDALDHVTCVGGYDACEWLREALDQVRDQLDTDQVRRYREALDGIAALGSFDDQPRRAAERAHAFAPSEFPAVRVARVDVEEP
jgi:hypothetical protein